MNSEVFISYSSKQKNVADGIKHYLEEYKVSCWMAPDSIPPSSSYPEEINKAISQCKVCLLVYSNTASLSPWVKKEVNQAINFGKPVLPFRIEETTHSDFFDFILSDTHWIEAYPHYADKLPPLLKAICAILDRPFPSSRLTGEDNIPDTNSNIQKGGEYSIGDTIVIGNQKGIVFYLDDSGKHGKVVSVGIGIKRWCNRSEYLIHRDTGAIYDDGKENLVKIKEVHDWEILKPAFAWCAKKGEGWYLPTIDDYRLIDKQKAIVGEKIGGIDERMWFWSSEQEDIYSARYYHFLSRQAHGLGKDIECAVLAIADF